MCVLCVNWTVSHRRLWAIEGFFQIQRLGEDAPEKAYGVRIVDDSLRIVGVIDRATHPAWSPEGERLLVFAGGSGRSYRSGSGIAGSRL